MVPFLRDLRHGWRALRHTPWYTLTVTSVLAVGIGLTTVAFAVVDGVLFKPLPFERAGELYLVRADAATAPQAQPPAVSWRDIRAWQEGAPGLAMTVISQGTPGSSASIDERFFEVTGTSPLFGGFSAADFDWLETAERTGPRIRPVLLTYRHWRKEYGGDPSVVGRTIIQTNRPGFAAGIRIAGVLPDGFVFPLDAGGAPPDTVAPIPHTGRPSADRDFHVIARAASAEDASVIGERLRAASRNLPETVPPPGHAPAALMQRVPFDEVRLIPLAEHLAEHERPAFSLVFAAAGVLLLLACVNLAGLVAARNIERRRDLAVRTALGATSWALTRALLAELAMPALLATGLALLIAKPLFVWTVNLLPATVTLLKAPAIDGRVFLAAVAAGLGAGALVSLWTIRFIESQLYGVDKLDPVVWTGVASLLTAVALTATVVPALRAGHADAVRALRAE